MNFVVKHGREEYAVDKDVVSACDTVAALKSYLQRCTGVSSSRQKILGLKVKGGGAVKDDTLLGDLVLRPGAKLMLMGSKEIDIEQVDVKPADSPVVVDDFDEDEDEILIQNREVYLAKIERRIRDTKLTILNEARPDKRLLVLDVDYTLFDHITPAERAAQLMRPYLLEFLTRSYEYYDIVIWSATSMKWIEAKMSELNVTNHPDFKICFMLDSSAMISVHLPERNAVKEVRPVTHYFSISSSSGVCAAGETTRCHLGQVSAVERQKHRHVRRRAQELPHESAEWPAYSRLPRCAQEPGH